MEKYYKTQLDAVNMSEYSLKRFIKRTLRLDPAKISPNERIALLFRSSSFWFIIK